ncbi:helix-turn-helix domain-containing protein [Novosphingobium sp. NPDC080210]|uniref:helix-turn-helix domain-containing protein n=1 Tax=Novosphingobium sp. NPDC080210 TaxID=3390596 RepID=UPI003CFF033B
MDIRKILGANLKRLRTAKGWSQEDYAFEAGIHRTYISDIERGARNPTIEVLVKLAAPLDVEAADLIRAPR